MWFCWVIFCILIIFNKTYNFKKMSFWFLSIEYRNMSNFEPHFLRQFPFQWYITCRHLNFDPTYENRHHGNFSPFWKLGILELVDHFVICTKIFLEVIGPYKNVKQEFALGAKTVMGLYYSIHKEIKSFKRNLAFMFFPAALKKKFSMLEHVYLIVNKILFRE